MGRTRSAAGAAHLYNLRLPAEGFRQGHGLWQWPSPGFKDWTSQTPESTNVRTSRDEITRIDLTDQTSGTSGDLWGACTGSLADVRDSTIPRSTHRRQHQPQQKGRGEMYGVGVINNPIENGDQECVMIQLLNHRQYHLGEPINSRLQVVPDLVCDGYRLESLAIVNLNGINFGANNPMQRVMTTFGMRLQRVNGSLENLFDIYFIEENI